MKTVLLGDTFTNSYPQLYRDSFNISNDLDRHIFVSIFNQYRYIPSVMLKMLNFLLL